MLFFTGVRIVWWGWTLRELPEGHAALMREAFARFGGNLPAGADLDRMILGNDRADLPDKRPDGTINLWGIARALFRAQVYEKYDHGMRQPWHHPTRTLPKVQHALYTRLLAAITTPDIAEACERFGGAMHTLQDTYTLGHTARQNNADPFSPLIRLHFSPSREHPFISPRDNVWEDKTQTRFTPEAEAAITATVAALGLWAELWPSSREGAGRLTAEFVQQYAPLVGQIFQASP